MIQTQSSVSKRACKEEEVEDEIGGSHGMGLAHLLFSGAGVAFYYTSDSFVVAPEVEAYME